MSRFDGRDRRPLRTRLVVGALVGLLAMAATSARSWADRPTSSPNRSRITTVANEPTVILYGDSLASESQAFFRDALVRAAIPDVHLRTFGGTALCDWLDVMRQDARARQPDAVVIEFSGNALTPCMHDARGEALTGDDYFAKYLEGATDALSIFSATRTRVYLVGAPMSRLDAESGDHDPGRLNALYAALASRSVRYVDAGAAVLDHGGWTSVLPCRSDEPCTGGTDATGTRVNVVRAADGTHFCPVPSDARRAVTGDCPVWSSGAFRFGTAMANPVVRDLRPRRTGAVVGPEPHAASEAGRGRRERAANEPGEPGSRFRRFGDAAHDRHT